jgi:hypothetical protein
MSDTDGPYDNVSEIPPFGPWTGPPMYVIDVSKPYPVNGKLMRSITARHNDGFVCLRFDDVDVSTDSNRRDVNDSEPRF